MAEIIIDIHPCDLGALLNADPNPEITIVRREGDFPNEYIEYKGQLYRQTCDVPVTSDWGKQVLEDAKNVDLRKG